MKNKIFLISAVILYLSTSYSYAEDFICTAVTQNDIEVTNQITHTFTKIKYNKFAHTSNVESIGEIGTMAYSTVADYESELMPTDGNKITTYWLLKTYKSIGQAKSIYIDKTNPDNITYTYDTVAMMEDIPLDDSLGPKEQGTCDLIE